MRLSAISFPAMSFLQSLLTSKELLRGSERELLRDVQDKENEVFYPEIIGPAAEKLLASRKKK
jgi:hypothetical protein